MSFYSGEKSLYIAWVCFHNAKNSAHSGLSAQLDMAPLLTCRIIFNKTSTVFVILSNTCDNLLNAKPWLNKEIHSLYFRFRRRGSKKGKRSVTVLSLSMDIYLYRRFLNLRMQFCQLKFSVWTHRNDSLSLDFGKIFKEFIPSSVSTRSRSPKGK